MLLGYSRMWDYNSHIWQEWAYLSIGTAVSAPLILVYYIVQISTHFNSYWCFSLRVVGNNTDSVAMYNVPRLMTHIFYILLWQGAAESLDSMYTFNLSRRFYISWWFLGQYFGSTIWYLHVFCIVCCFMHPITTLIPC